MTPQVEPAISALLADALWLTEIELLDVSDGGWRKKAVERLRSRFGVDDLDAERACQGIAGQAPDFFGKIDLLYAAAFHLRQGVPVLRSDARAIRLSRAIDPEILASLAPGPFVRTGTDVRHELAAPSAEMARLLALGSFETHTHLGGCIPPGYYWTALMSGRLPLQLFRFRDPESGWASTKTWIAALRRAFVMRLRLGAFATTTRADPFPLLPLANDAVWGPFLEMFSRASDHAECDSHALELLTQLVPWNPDEEPEDWAYSDPFRLGLPKGERRTASSGERRLLHAVACHLRQERALGSEEKADAGMEELLLSYVRIRNAFFQVLIYESGSCGLTRFVQAFGRQSFMARRTPRKSGRRGRRLRKEALRFERFRGRAAVETQLVEPFRCVPVLEGATRGLELRTSLDPGKMALHTLHAWLQGALQALNRRVSEREDPLARKALSGIGFVIHILKGRETLAEHSSKALCSILREYPGLRRFIVGIDAAGPERKAAPRSHLRLYERVRHLCENYRVLPEEPTLKVGLTYHVGEDCDDLLTALRHMDEVATLLFGGEGRFGHALALGDEPARFYARRGNREPGRGTHALDLVWAWGRAREAGLLDWSAFAERLLQQLFGLTRASIERCWSEMDLSGGGGRPAPSVTSIDRPTCENDLARRLLGQDDKGVVPIEASREWIEFTKALQSCLRRRLARMAIVVEANPTSNLLIGGYPGFGQLPYDPIVESGIRLSINTDDPGIMSTSLPGEFERVFEARAALSERRLDAVRWIEDRARDARDSTFLTVFSTARELRRRIDRAFIHRNPESGV